MRALPRPLRSIILILALVSAALPALSQRTGYSREEFQRRRQVLREKTKEGLIVLFGEDHAPAAAPKDIADIERLMGKR